MPLPPNVVSPINDLVLPPGTILHRTHAKLLAPRAFNPCRGQPSRFAPFRDNTTDLCVPTLYAATTREAAVFESIFHDIDPAAAFKTIRLNVIDLRSVSVLALVRPLRLARLFTPDLKAWSLDRNQLIDTPKSTYGRTAAWARAIHTSDRTIDGLIWTSRQCDPDLCIVAFGDRVAETDFSLLEQRDVESDATLLLEIREFGRRAGITIIA